jgi:general secretion pathway protein L
MGSLPEFIDKMAAELDKEVRSVNLQQVAGVKFGQGQQEKWVPGIYDHALALSMQGFRKKATVNFRKGEFALPKLYYAAKNQLAAAAVVVVSLLAATFIYLGYDYRALKTKNDELGSEIIAIYKETFPDVKTVNRPSVALADMQVKLRNVKGPSISTPIFSGDKRSLNILADISGRIPATVKIDVARMVIDKETITIKGTTDTFNNVNLIQNVLRKSTAYEDVDIVSAAAEKDGGSIRFELRLQTVKSS